MKPIPTTVSLAVAVALSLAWTLPANAESSIWTPNWKQGDYWIVRSPLHRHVPVPGTSDVVELQDGYYFTRFLVKSDERTAASRTVVLEIKYRENEAFTFDDMLDSAEIVFDMSTLRVVRARKLGPSGDGTPIDWETKVPPDERAFQWRYGPVGVPPTLPVLVPAFTRTEVAGQFQLSASTESSSIGPELDLAQDVVATPQGLLVRFWTGVGAATRAASAKVEEELLFRPDKPWPDVHAADGSAIATVVEVGHVD